MQVSTVEVVVQFVQLQEIKVGEEFIILGGSRCVLKEKLTRRECAEPRY